MNQFEKAVELARRGYVVAWFGRCDNMSERLGKVSAMGASNVRRAHGFERADWPNGGRFLFLSTNTTSGRGYCVDFVFIPEELRADGAWSDIAPMVNCSRAKGDPIYVVSKP